MNNLYLLDNIRMLQRFQQVDFLLEFFILLKWNRKQNKSVTHFKEATKDWKTQPLVGMIEIRRNDIRKQYRNTARQT